MRNKLIAFTLLGVFALSFLAIQIWALIDTHGDEFTRLSIGQLVRRRPPGTEASVMPNRGTILDRNHQVLAFSTIKYHVFMDVRHLVGMTQEQQADIISRVSEILGIPTEELWPHLALREDGRPVFDTHHRIFARYVSLETAMELQAARTVRRTDNDPRGPIRHVHLQETSQRTYLYGNIAPQIIGFEWGDSIRGLESRFNRELSGVPGRLFRIYDPGGLGIITERVEAQQGHTIVTTLDLVIQQIAEEVAAKYGNAHNARHTIAIVMNPWTGAIVAMATYPSFDLNHAMNPAYLTSTHLAAQWADLDNATLASNFESIWQNFNITHTFEPGSIFKPFVIAAALEAGVIDFNDTFVCNGFLYRDGFRMNCHRRVGHGRVDVRQANAYSCNVALMLIAEQMGGPLFYQFQRYFGFGQRTGIDLPAEASAAGLQHGPNMRPSELAASSFGQTLRITPIQAITAFSSLINGGYLMQPFVVSHVIDQNNRVVQEHQPLIQRQVLSAEVSDWLRDAMVETFVTGTARLARLPGHNIGGKSGTADQGLRESPDHYVATAFVGYFPAENPQYVVLVTIYDTGDGTTAPARYMFTELVSNIINYRRIPSTDQAQTAANTVPVRDFSNMRVNEAAAILNNQGVPFELIGNGDIVAAQFPLPGTTITTSGSVFLFVENSDDATLAAVPDLDGMSLRQARIAVSEAGFIPHIVFSQNNMRDEDINHVNSQSPSPWQRVPQGMQVTIRVGG